MVANYTKLFGRMTDMEHQAVDHTFLGLLFGPSGAGKTTLAMWTAQSLIAEGESIIYVDSADGWVSLENAPSLMENAYRLAYEGYDDLIQLAEAIKRKAKGFEKVRVVVIDELDSVSDDVLVAYVRDKHGTEAGEKSPEIEGKDYRPMGDLIKHAIKKFQEAGVHLILVAHDRKDVDHRKVTITSPGLTPKLKTSIVGLMHVVAYITAEVKGSVKKPEYVRQVQSLPTMLVEAKSRIGALRNDVKVSHDFFVDAVSSWVGSTEMDEELLKTQADEDELLPDEIPTDGIPVAEADDSEDDEPALVGEIE